MHRYDKHNPDRIADQQLVLTRLRSISAQLTNLEQIADDIQSGGLDTERRGQAERALRKLADQVEDALDDVVDAVPSWVKALEPLPTDATPEQKAERREQLQMMRGAAGLER